MWEKTILIKLPLNLQGQLTCVTCSLTGPKKFFVGHHGKYLVSECNSCREIRDAKKNHLLS